MGRPRTSQSVVEPMASTYDSSYRVGVGALGPPGWDVVAARPAALLAFAARPATAATAHMSRVLVAVERDPSGDADLRGM